MVNAVLEDGYEWPMLFAYPVWSSLVYLEVCGGYTGVRAYAWA